MDFAYYGSLALLILGFGFVIFWHELGHFLAAKWAGVRVEQFAVGFGHALMSWRQGLGFRWGTSRPEYDSKLREFIQSHEDALKKNPQYVELATEDRRLEYASAELGISPTEYRLNWIPLGGYVKMLGQDDLDPNAQSESPNAYNNKPISKRMVIVSAGVIMNIILAIILFTILFRMGFNVPPPVIGIVTPGSPSQLAGVRVGDRVLSYDGQVQHDFTKLKMNVALSEAEKPVQLVVRRPDGKEESLQVLPQRSEGEPGGFLQIGMGSSSELRGLDPALLSDADKAELAQEPVRLGETVVAINGKSVGVKDYYVLDEAAQTGRPVPITVEDTKGVRQDRVVNSMLVLPFGRTPLNVAGMTPRTVIRAVEPGSSAVGKLKRGDIVQELTIQPGNDAIPHPSRERLMEALGNAGKNHSRVEITVIRDGQTLTFKDLDASMRVEEGRKGLGVALLSDEDHPLVADVMPGSAAAAAQIPAGATIKTIGSQAVQSWHDIQRVLAAAQPDQAVAVEFTTEGGENKRVEMKLTADQLQLVRQNRYVPDVALREMYEPRRTNNPIEAASWGISETRDLTLQFYITLRRMFQGSVSASNMMGPLGIFHQGSKIAYRGTDWLIWFLAMISANLAVVNFLPIPIVDGGLFVFLILEKIMGKPLSPKAQSIAQIVGLALIASVFLFVTYHDISRLIF